MKTINSAACVSSSVGVSENLNKQFLSVILEMILSDANLLEIDIDDAAPWQEPRSIVSPLACEGEINRVSKRPRRKLMGKYNESNLELVINELEAALSAAKESELTEKLDAEAIETVSPVIEQQMDPESFESTSYSIDLPGYSSSSYDAGKYYDMVQGENSQTGATITSTTDYQHEFLQEAQEMVASIKQGSETNHPFVEALIDTNIKYLKDSIKILSPVMWKLMYEGKIIFN